MYLLFVSGVDLLLHHREGRLESVWNEFPVAVPAPALSVSPGTTVGGGGGGRVAIISNGCSTAPANAREVHDGRVQRGVFHGRGGNRRNPFS